MRSFDYNHEWMKVHCQQERDRDHFVQKAIFSALSASLILTSISVFLIVFYVTH